MKKFTINLNELSQKDDPILYLFELFGFETNDVSIEKLYLNLIEIEEYITIEMVQNELIADDIYRIIDCFENVQQKSENIYFIRGLE